MLTTKHLAILRSAYYPDARNDAEAYLIKASAAERDIEALGPEFCKLSHLMGRNPWDLAAEVIQNLDAFEMAKTSEDQQTKELAEFYGWWAQELEKQADLWTGTGRLIGRGLELGRRMLGAGRSAAQAVASVPGRIAQVPGRIRAGISQAQTAATAPATKARLQAARETRGGKVLQAPIPGPAPTPAPVKGPPSPEMIWGPSAAAPSAPVSGAQVVGREAVPAAAMPAPAPGPVPSPVKPSIAPPVKAPAPAPTKLVSTEAKPAPKAAPSKAPKGKKGKEGKGQKGKKEPAPKVEAPAAPAEPQPGAAPGEVPLTPEEMAKRRQQLIDRGIGLAAVGVPAYMMMQAGGGQPSGPPSY